MSSLLVKTLRIFSVEKEKQVYVNTFRNMLRTTLVKVIVYMNAYVGI